VRGFLQFLNDMMKIVTTGETQGAYFTMLSGLSEFVVQGITTEGVVFQPPGWAQQLLDKLAGSGAGVAYASCLRPSMIEGVESLIVRAVLKETDPRAFNMIRQFVAENHLMVRAGRGGVDAEGSGPQRAVDQERRNPKRDLW